MREAVIVERLPSKSRETSPRRSIAIVRCDSLRLKTPEADLSTYEFNRHVIKHHFCNHCGIAPFGEGAGPNGPMAAINLRCLPEFDIEAVKIVKYDGLSV